MIVQVGPVATTVATTVPTTIGLLGVDDIDHQAELLSRRDARSDTLQTKNALGWSGSDIKNYPYFRRVARSNQIFGLCTHD